MVQALLANTSTQAFFSPDPEDAGLVAFAYRGMPSELFTPVDGGGGGKARPRDAGPQAARVLGRPNHCINRSESFFALFADQGYLANLNSPE